jgi:hypothetical protein
MQRAALNRDSIEVADTSGVCGAHIRFGRVADTRIDLFRKGAFTISCGHFFSLADER